MKRIICCSFGKDSTATVILAHELGIPIDYIIFAEVMFDKNVSAEHPEHIQFVKEKAIPVFRSWGYEVKILHAPKTYLDMFYHRIERPVKYPEHKGMKYGFALGGGMCHIKRDLKLKPIAEFIRGLQDEEVIEYVGICADELRRLTALSNRKQVSLLSMCGYTQKMSRELCESYGLLSPTYELSSRGGCWVCPYAKRCEHRRIRELYPDTWKKFVSLEKEENVAHDKFFVHGESLSYREALFEQEAMYI